MPGSRGEHMDPGGLFLGTTKGRGVSGGPGRRPENAVQGVPVSGSLTLASCRGCFLRSPDSPFGTAIPPVRNFTSSALREYRTRPF
jgi:hypothetical protein